MQWSFQWEENFLLFLQEHVRSPWLDKCMNAVTRLGDAGFVAILACLVMLAIPAMRWAGRLAAMSLLMDFLVVNVILKNLVGRVRPYVAIEGLLPIARLPADASFPSGHAGACFAVAGVLFWLAFYPGKYPGAKKPGRALKAAGVMAMVLLPHWIFPAVCGGPLSHGCAGRRGYRTFYLLVCGNLREGFPVGKAWICTRIKNGVLRAGGRLFTFPGCCQDFVYASSEKSSLPTEQRGHTQSSGRSSKAVTGLMPLSGSPISGSYTYPQVSQTYFFMKSSSLSLIFYGITAG